MGIALIFLATLFLAYANGANDNFKGVATLFGSKTINYRDSLYLATITTLAGSLCSVYLSLSLIKIFSGKGLVPDSIAASPEFLLTVAIGAGLTIMLATLTGFPVSTTHSLTGALIGAGFMAIGTQINLNTLINSFLQDTQENLVEGLGSVAPSLLRKRTTPCIRRPVFADNVILHKAGQKEKQKLAGLVTKGEGRS